MGLTLELGLGIVGIVSAIVGIVFNWRADSILVEILRRLQRRPPQEPDLV